MKLPNLIVIFLALALPVILVLSFYVGLQVDTASLRGEYNSRLINATHETMVAFELNTTNSKYSTVADAKIRDIEAAKNIFSSSLATSFGATGSSRSFMMSYVPALVFTLYDGYYIYTPTKTWDSNMFTHELKSYVYYSKKYESATGSRSVSINFSLDNYVAVYYYDNSAGTKFTSRAGYLEIIPNSDSAKNNFLSGLDDEAKQYYQDAWNFTEWFNNEVVSNLQADAKEVLEIKEGNSALMGAESRFNDERTSVIKNTIVNNLVQSMVAYSKNTTSDFQMPELTEPEWETVLTNVCCISFLQGLPLGTTIYNGYAIAVSSENKEVVTADDLVFIGDDGSYHRIWCPHLTGSTINGYNKLDVDLNNADSSLRTTPACYYCVINASNPSIDAAEKYANEHPTSSYNLTARQKAYYSALAKQKLWLTKTSSFINGSKELG